MLTTVCVSCSTAFRVTSEQLKLRDGRVRCGNCDTVFNALITLTEGFDREQAPEVLSKSSEFGGVAPIPSALAQLARISTDRLDLAASEEALLAASGIVPTADAIPGEIPAETAQIDAADVALSAVWVPEPSDVSEPLDVSGPSEVSKPSEVSEPLDVSAPSEVSEPIDVSAPSEVSEPLEVSKPSDVSEPSAIVESAAIESAAKVPGIEAVELPAGGNHTQAPGGHASPDGVSQSIPKHQEFGFHTVSQVAGTRADFDFGPKVFARRGWWWTPLSILLFLVLLAQSAFYFRGAIAFMLPQTKPVIVEICAELGCEVPLPRRAELITIESSDLKADPTNPGVIALLVTLRNRAAFPQTFPALELTLTNEREQPLARRVLHSNDYLADKTEAFEGSSERQIRLDFEAGSLKASGYRLYVFYP